MKKAITILTAALLFAFFWITAYAAEPGDVDGNGNVTAADARLALRAAVGLEPEITPDTEAFLAADTDFNGALTSEDARSILRAAVGLEDLHDRLPESEALTEEELRQKFNGSVLRFSVKVRSNTVNSGYGFVIDDDGTVVVRYSLLEKAIEILSREKGVTVQSILYTDPVSDLALLKVKGDVPHIAVNRTWYDYNDTVYTLNYGKLVACTLTTPPVGIEPSIPSATICASVPILNRSFDGVFPPLLDRFGRAVGFVASTKSSANGTEYIFAIPLSKLPPSDECTPITVDAFSREQWKATLLCSYDAIEIVQNGVAAIPLVTENGLQQRLFINNPNPDLIDVTYTYVEKDEPVLQIMAKQPGKSIPVRVSMEGRYETKEITLRVSVTKEGYVNIPGLPVIPDPGVVWGCLPNSFTVQKKSRIELNYLKSDTDLSTEEMFYTYAGYLLEMGYTHVKTVPGMYSNCYWFRLQDTHYHVEYIETDDCVKIIGMNTVTELY